MAASASALWHIEVARNVPWWRRPTSWRAMAAMLRSGKAWREDEAEQEPAA